MSNPGVPMPVRPANRQRKVFASVVTRTPNRV